MPDIADILNTAADEVEIRDLLDDVHVGVRRRQRRRMIAAVTATAVVVAGVIIGSVGYSGSHAGETGPVRKPAPSTTAKPLPLTARLPRYLPPGVHLARQGPGGTFEISGAVYHAVYAANHAAIYFAIVDDKHPKPCPPPRRLGARTSPRRLYPCGSQIYWMHTSVPLASGYSQQINGETGFVAESSNDFGPQDIEWLEGDYHYYLEENRLTPGGGAPNGVVFSQLVRMAESVPVDPSVPRVTPLPNPPAVRLPSSITRGLYSEGRELIDDNGISMTFGGQTGFDLEVAPALPPVGATQTGSGGPTEDSRTHGRRGRSRPVQVRGRNATAWTGRGENLPRVALTCRIGEFDVLIEGGRGWTVSDLVRIADAMQIIPHSP